LFSWMLGDVREADVALSVAAESCALAHDALELVGQKKPRDVFLGSERTRILVRQVDPVVKITRKEDDAGGRSEVCQSANRLTSHRIIGLAGRTRGF
jgi:hypothetical protein